MGLPTSVRRLAPKRVLRYALARGLVPVQIALAPVERRVARRLSAAGLGDHPPVFIIGPPRSGSTLLYKVLTDRYQFGYFTNLTANLPRLAVLGWFLSQALRAGDRPDGYAIEYGHVRGRGGPHECGEFWYRWFPRGLDVYVGPGEMSQRARTELRDEVGGLARASRRPVIFKNLYNSMRLAPLVEAFPEASFLVCRRDEVEIAASIVRGRHARQRDPAEWWSLAPKEVGVLLGRDVATQVAGQVIYIYRQIEHDRERLGPERFLDVRYEDLCSDVHGTLDLIEAFLAGRGCALANRGPVPPRFDLSTTTSHVQPDREVLRCALDHMRAELGP